MFGRSVRIMGIMSLFASICAAYSQEPHDSSIISGIHYASTRQEPCRKPEECRWECTDPRCSPDCRPVCQHPKCHIACKPTPCVSCREVCVGNPECEMRCSDFTCFGDGEGCPNCKAFCSKTQCRPMCHVPVPDCKAECEEPACKWNCTKPVGGCEVPKCRLRCNTSPCTISDTDKACCPCADHPSSLIEAVSWADRAMQSHGEVMKDSMRPSLVELLDHFRMEHSQGVQECCPCGNQSVSPSSLLEASTFVTATHENSKQQMDDSILANGERVLPKAFPFSSSSNPLSKAPNFPEFPSLPEMPTIDEL